MKKITQNLRWLVTLLAMIVSTGAWAQEVYYEWVETDPSELVTGDIVVIADKTSSTAMANNKGTSVAPTATSVELNSTKSKITGTVDETLQWEVTVSNGSTSSNYFRFNIPRTENYLYCNNTNNGVRVGTNSNYIQSETDYSIFDITVVSDKNYLHNVNRLSRVLGVFDSQDWRCYNGVNTNIEDTETAFYKRVESSTPPVTITITISDEKLTNKDVYVSTNAGKLSATVKEGDTTIDNPSITWTSSNESVATISIMGAVTLVSAGTTTITAAYNGYTAEYELVVTSSAPQITDFTVTLNNAFFGTNYSGSVSGITDDNPVSGTNNNVTIVYAGSGNHYINDSQTRFYPNNKLTFTSPEGYVFTKIEFTKSGTWACTITSEVGTVTSNTTWTGQANEVVLTGSGSSRCDMTVVAITLAELRPSIVVSPTIIDVSAEGGDGTIEVTYQAFEPESPDYEFYESDGVTVTEGPDWIYAEINTETGNVDYLIEENDGEARSAYFKVIGYIGEGIDPVYSELITITQAAVPQAYTLTIVPDEHADFYIFYNNDEFTEIANSDDMLSNDNVLSNSEIFISTSAKNGYVLESVTVTDGNGNIISLNDVEGEEGIAWTFTMPESDVTVSCTVKPLQKFTFEKVTSTDDLVAGAEYIIVCGELSTVLAAIGPTEKYYTGKSVVISNNTITVEEGSVNILTLGGAEDAWTLAPSLEENMYLGLGSASNELRHYGSDSQMIYWTISFDEDGNSNIQSNSVTSETRTIRYNSAANSLRFACYKDYGQKAIQLYKKVVEEEDPTVTIGASKWATYVAEDNVTFPSEVSAYTVETIKTDHVTLGEALAVKKGTPILVYSNTPGTYTLEVVAEEDCEDTFNNQLKVSDGSVTGSANIYALANKDQGVGFYPVGNGIAVPAGKAYLEISGSTQSVKGFLALGDFADAINNITAETANGTIFNIAGQKVQNITKGGLYIVNGKKVVVK
ncbi:MAG: Ig-like domain-containing protein [Bacteroidaceae bacterium]|nr:Ig-like domain-containing protein [Bacteroidaceae bacterium]